ncbi:hypothetical protein V2J09_005431 [Rumex salicifolius]
MIEKTQFRGRSRRKCREKAPKGRSLQRTRTETKKAPISLSSRAGLQVFIEEESVKNLLFVSSPRRSIYSILSRTALSSLHFYHFFSASNRRNFSMNSLQVASFRPLIDVKKISRINGLSSVPCITTAHFQNLSKTCLKLTIGRPKYQRCPPVCMFEGKSEYSNQEPLENSIGDSGKKLSLEEILRQQIERQEGSGGVPPSDGGGGGGRGGRGRRGRGGDSGGSEEGTPAEQWDELLQVTLATMGLISLYLYILHGPEITRLGKDYLRFLLSRNQSVRLKRAMYVFGRLWRSLTQKKKVVVAEDSIALLQREILNTPTWYDSPSKYQHIVEAYMASKLSDHE